MIRLLNSSSTYGEITTKGFRELAKRIELYSGDCFLDMGSGVGRVVVQAALEFGCRSSLGVELSMTRHQRAQQALLDVISARGALHALMVHGGMGSAKTIPLEGVRLVQGTLYCPIVRATALENGFRRDLPIVKILLQAACRISAFAMPPVGPILRCNAMC